MEGLEGTDGCKEKEERSTSPWRDNNDTHGTEYQMGSRCNDALFFLLKWTGKTSVCSRETNEFFTSNIFPFQSLTEATVSSSYL